MGGVLEDSVFVYMLKKCISPSNPHKIYDNQESGTSWRNWRRSSSTTLSLDIFCKSKSKQVIARKCPKFNKKKIFFFSLSLFRSIVKLKLFFYVFVSFDYLIVYFSKKQTNCLRRFLDIPFAYPKIWLNFTYYIKVITKILFV